MHGFFGSTLQVIAHHKDRIRTEQAIEDFHIFKRDLSTKLVGKFLMITGVDVFVETVTSYFNLSRKKKHNGVVFKSSIILTPGQLGYVD